MSSLSSSLDEILSARCMGHVAGARDYSHPVLGRRLSALSPCRVCPAHAAHRRCGGPGHPPLEWPPGGLALLAVVQQAEHVILLEAIASVKKVEFDGESQANDISPQPANQLHRRFHRAPGC